MNKHPSEYPQMYLEDPPKEIYKTDFHTGVEQSAIYKEILFDCVGETDFGIVLTPQCEIGRAEPENYVLLARIVPIREMWYWWLAVKNKHKYTEEEIIGKVPISKGKTNKKNLVSNFIEKYLKNETFQYYFIPMFEDKIPHSFICYDVTQCMQIKDLKSVNKVCVLKSPFREAVPTHYASYIGRVGTTDYRPEYFYDVMGEICKLREE